MSEYDDMLINLHYEVMRRQDFCDKYKINQKTLEGRVIKRPESQISDLIYPATKNGRPKKEAFWQDGIYSYEVLSEKIGITPTAFYQRMVKSNNDINKVMTEQKPLRMAGGRPKSSKNIAKYAATEERDPMEVIIEAWRNDGATDDQILFRLKNKL